jgi:hypothetical protein
MTEPSLTETIYIFSSFTPYSFFKSSIIVFFPPLLLNSVIVMSNFRLTCIYSYTVGSLASGVEGGFSEVESLLASLTD